jgi:hypothetical protein
VQWNIKNGIDEKHEILVGVLWLQRALSFQPQRFSGFVRAWMQVLGTLPSTCIHTRMSSCTRSGADSLKIEGHCLRNSRARFSFPSP